MRQMFIPDGFDTDLNDIEKLSYLSELRLCLLYLAFVAKARVAASLLV